MKKIDLHLHTVKSVSDYDFQFSLEKLKKYICEREIDAIAITNVIMRKCKASFSNFSYTTVK